MGANLSRKQLAERLGVKISRIYGWEKRGISPVTPQRHKVTRELIYNEAHIPIYEEWLNATEDKVIQP